MWNSYLQEMVDKYSRSDTPYLFPVITSKDLKEQWRQHDTAIHNINRNLKKVGQIIGLSFPLTLTVAHHTWKSMSNGLNVVDLL